MVALAEGKGIVIKHIQVDCLEKAGLDVKVIFTDHKEHKKAAAKH